MRADQGDHRIQHLKITSKAVPYINEIKKYQESFTRAALADIDKQALECMDETIKKIEDNMQKIIRGEKEL